MKNCVCWIYRNFVHFLKICVYWIFRIVFEIFLYIECAILCTLNIKKLCSLNILNFVYFLKNCVYNSIYTVLFTFFFLIKKVWVKCTKFLTFYEKLCILNILNYIHSIINYITWIYKIVYNVPWMYIHVKYNINYIFRTRIFLK